MEKHFFKPVITSIQKILLYETKTKYFVVGSNNNQTKFRILKIDRTEPFDLVIIDDQVEYTEYEVFQILNTGCRGKTAAYKTVSAFGIVGFIRFLEGYYMILINKRRRVASIGLHAIYKIEDTNLIYIPHESHRVPNSDESRYLKMFQSIDLSSNFYFSYSYDITNTLQINMAKPNVDLNASADRPNLYRLSNNKPEIGSETDYCGIRSKPNRKFVWNCHLLSDVENVLNSEWILYITHGFVSQSSVSIFGRSIYVTLIARRSNKYAGTRFLKRGANFSGDVANEVETEQMVIDTGVSSSSNLRVSSFVQLRGSIPAQWSQDITKMVAKPAITFDLSDPFFETAGAHFNELLRRYGSPIVILNLVKQREKKKHESQLSEEFSSAVSYLNQFLPPKHYIQYITFDMARMNKGKEAKVMDRLAKIARSALSKTGLFLNNCPPVNNSIIEKITEGNSLQTGIIRVNCVDCLDRTNTAQFALGKCALGYQLYYVGLLEKPCLEFDSDCVRLLEVLYEDHGDTLALQYGGSQLVHRIKTYRKTAPWTSQGNDIMQTLSRYYSNTFSDTEKQHAMNLFLGLYIPQHHKQPIWEQNIDYYLHHPQAVGLSRDRRFPLTQWWDSEVIDCLPLSYNLINKQCVDVTTGLSKYDDYLDIYNHFHRTDEFTVIGESYEFNISHTIRDFMPRCVTDFSPFTVRIRPGRMREETSKSGSNMKNPSLTGQSSTSSTNSSSSSSYDTSDDETHFSDSQCVTQKDDTISEGSITSALPSANEVYGIQINAQLSKNDHKIYDRYTLIATRKDEYYSKGNNSMNNEIIFENLVPLDSDSFEVTVPQVKQESVIIYETFINRKCAGVSCCSDLANKYQKYCNNELGVFSSWYNVTHL